MRNALLLALLVAATAAPAMAHHPFASEYEGTAPVLVKGKVVSIDWKDPHVLVHVQADTIEHWSNYGERLSSGQPVTDQRAWVFETAPLRNMRANGLDERTFVQGDLVTIRGFLAKDRACTSECKAYGRDVTFGDGTRLMMAGTSAESQRKGVAFRERRLAVQDR
jgi:hypothetical protein